MVNLEHEIILINSIIINNRKLNKYFIRNELSRRVDFVQGDYNNNVSFTLIFRHGKPKK